MSILQKIEQFTTDKELMYVSMAKKQLTEIFGENYREKTFHLRRRDHFFIIFEEKHLYFCSFQIMNDQLYLLKNTTTKQYVTKFCEKNFEAILRFKAIWEEDIEFTEDENKKRELQLFHEILLHKDYRLKYLFH